MTPCAARPFRGFISGPGDTFGTRSQRGRAFFDLVRFSRAFRAVLQADPVRKRLSKTVLRDVLVRTGFFLFPVAYGFFAVLSGHAAYVDFRVLV